MVTGVQTCALRSSTSAPLPRPCVAGSERRGRRPDALRPRRPDRGGGAGSGCARGREDRRPSDRLGGGAGPAVAPAHGGTADGGDDPLGVLLGGDLGAERVGADPGVPGLAAEGELAQDALADGVDNDLLAALDLPEKDLLAQGVLDVALDGAELY